MDIYHKWKELLSDADKRTEWIGFYIKNDPIFNAVTDFCKNQIAGNETVLELALIAILDEKVKGLSERHRMAHSMSRPLPTKLKEGQKAYPEDDIDFGEVDEQKVDACQDFANEMRERLRGTILEHEMLSGKRYEGNDPTSTPLAPDDDALIEQCNAVEGLLRCIWEDARSDYEDEKGKCLVSSELIGKISSLLSDGDTAIHPLG